MNYVGFILFKKQSDGPIFKSAIIASVCAIGIQAAYIDIDASAGSHSKYRGPPPGPRLIVVDQGPNYPPPPPPRARTPPPRRVVRQVVRQAPPRIIHAGYSRGPYYGSYGYGGYGYGGYPVYGGYGYGGYGGYGHGYGGYGHGHGYGHGYGGYGGYY